MTTVAPAPSSGCRVRQAERDDLFAVYQVEQACFPQPWPFTAFEQYVGRPGFLVADAGRVVGYIVADTVPNGTEEVGHIKDLAVRKDCRREGIGSMLLASAVMVLDEYVSALKLEVRENNDSAIALYRDHGFEYRQTVLDYYGNGEDALVMVRSL